MRVLYVTQKTILEALKIEPMTTKELSNHTGLSIKMVQTYLSRLRKKGIVDYWYISEDGRQKRIYVVSDDYEK